MAEITADDGQVHFSHGQVSDSFTWQVCVLAGEREKDFASLQFNSFTCTLLPPTL